MEQTLLLNATYEPLKVVHWQKAITLWCQGKVEVISVVRPRGPVRLVQLQAAVGHPPAALHQDQAQYRLRAVFARQHLRARRSLLPVLRRGLSHGRSDLRSCGAGRPGRPQGLGEHRHLLRDLQPPEGRTDAGRSRHAPHAGAQTARQGAGHPHHRRPQERPGELARLLLLEHGAGRDREPPVLVRAGHDRRRSGNVPVDERRFRSPASPPSSRCGPSKAAGHHRRRTASRSTRRLPRSASAGSRPGSTVVSSQAADGRSSRPGSKAGTPRCASDDAPGETAFVEVGDAAGDRPPPGRQPGVRPRRQPLRDVQRFARAAGAGLDLHGPARRHARAVRRGPRQSDVDGVRSRRAALRFEPVRRQRPSHRRRRRARRCRRPISASPCGIAFGPDGALLSAIDRARFCASTRRARRRSSPASRRASPRFISRSVPTAVSTSPPRRWRRATRSIAISPDGEVEVVLRRLRPAAGAGVRRSTAHLLRRRRARRLERRVSAVARPAVRSRAADRRRSR